MPFECFRLILFRGVFETLKALFIQKSLHDNSQKTVEKRRFQIGGDPALLRQELAQIKLHAPGLDNHRFRLKNIR